MQKVYQKLTRRHERKHEQHGAGGSGPGGYYPPPGYTGGGYSPSSGGGGGYAYSRSRSETAVNGGGRDGFATANGGGYYAGSRSGSQLRNGGSGYVHGSQQHIRRDADFQERSRSRGGMTGEYRNGYAASGAGAAGGGGGGGAYTEQQRFYDAATGAHGFSESSSWEQREHFERKMQKGAKQRGLVREGSAAALVRDGSRSRIVEGGASYTNGLAIERGNLDDLVSRLTRGIGITNEKLDHLLTRIDAVDAAAERGERIELLERQVREIGDDLHMLKPPIDELFLDVDTLRQHRHADAADFNKQVIGLEQRRTAYLGRLEDELMRRLGLSQQGARYVTERYSTASSGTRGNAFRRVEDAIQWIRDRMHKLNSMQFSETLEVLEQIFEQHKLDNRDIQDFRQTVDECIARQAEVSAEDSYDYCELLKMMESEYQQLRELSAGRMVDLDSLIAFIRAAQLELLWIHQREELEVTRNWSDLERLDIPMLQNYFKQLLHEIELHEKQFNDVHNQGAALINQRHPAGEVIEVYLRTMQNQWDWMLNLSKCLEGHLRDAYNAKAFVEESEQVEQQMQQQLDHLDREYSRTDFSLDDGEQMLRQLDSVREYIQQLHARLLTDRQGTSALCWTTMTKFSGECAEWTALRLPSHRWCFAFLRLTRVWLHSSADCTTNSRSCASCGPHPSFEPDYSNQFDAACAELVRKFEEGWKQLNHRVQERVATNLEELELPSEQRMTTWCSAGKTFGSCRACTWSG